MNRRKLLSLAASLPIVGAFVKNADGVALRSTSHPVGVGSLDTAVEPSSIVDWQIRLPRYAAAGEQVTCENGHLICEFLVDVAVGQTQDLERQLGNWTQEPPEIGQISVPGCAVCGAEFYRGGVFHFSDGWRTFPRRPFMVSRR